MTTVTVEDLRKILAPLLERLDATEAWAKAVEAERDALRAQDREELARLRAQTQENLAARFRVSVATELMAALLKDMDNHEMLVGTALRLADLLLERAQPAAV